MCYRDRHGSAVDVEAAAVAAPAAYTPVTHGMANTSANASMRDNARFHGRCFMCCISFR